MSHRDDCPSRYEARRQGERDFESRGYRSYSDRYDCDEANRAYQDGQRSAQYEAELEAERRDAARLEHLRQQRWEQECAEAEDRDRYEREQHEYYERLVEEMEIEAAAAEVWGDGP